MSNFGKKYDPNKRELNKILRENKYDPKDPYRLFRESTKRQKREEKARNKTSRSKKTKIKFNIWSIIVWVVLVAVYHVFEK